MIIREAKINDVKIIAGFQLKMAIETEDMQLDAAVLQQGLIGLLGDPAKGKYYLAEIEGKPAGCLMLTSEWSDWRNGMFLWIQSVYVDTVYRRQGVYTKLYQHIVEIVKSNPGLIGVRLYVENGNLSAQKVYKNLGMNGDHYKVFEWINFK